MTREELTKMTPVQLVTKMAGMTQIEIADLLKDLAAALNDMEKEAEKEKEETKKIAITQDQFDKHFYISTRRGRPKKEEEYPDNLTTPEAQEEFKDALKRK